MKIRVPDSKVGQFLFFGITQFVAYFIIVANTIAYTHGHYMWTAITDAFYAGQSFIMIRLIAKEDDKKGLWSGLGYTVGGTLGSLASMWVTKHVYGQ